MTDNDILVLLGTNPREWGDLDGADLGRLFASASDADLGRLCASASDADLGRLCANASGADLGRLFVNASGAALGRLERITKNVPLLDKPYTRISEAIHRSGCSLEMSSWHKCDTTHCLAGWTVHLAGKAGYELEKLIDTPAAAALILRKSRPKAPLPNFYAGDEAAKAFIEARRKEEAA